MQYENGKRVVNLNSRHVIKKNVDDVCCSNLGNYCNNKAVNVYVRKYGIL